MTSDNGLLGRCSSCALPAAMDECKSCREGRAVDLALRAVRLRYLSR